MSKHVVEIQFTATGLDQILAQTGKLSKGTTDLTKTTTGLNKETKATTDVFAMTKKSGEDYFKTTGNLSKGQQTLSKSTNDTTTTINKASTSTNTLSKSQTTTAGSAAKLGTSFRPLIFSTTSIATAGIEAVGMWGQYQNATRKVEEAQAIVNQLVAAGAEGSAEHTQATRELTEAQRGQQFAQRILILSMSDLIPMSLMAANTIAGLIKQFKESKMATDTLAQSTTNLATAKKTAAIPAFTDFNKVLTETPILSKNVVTGLDGTTKAVTAQKTPLTQLGALSTQTFGGMTIEVDKTNKSMTNSGSIFSKFGTVAKGALTGLGGALRAAGTAAAAFGKALLTAFMTNPILAALTAITVAITALIFDFGGFRTAINNVGVAIGNAIPQLKGFLTGLGEAANGALDYVASLFGVEKKQTDVGTSADGTKPKIDALAEAYNQAYTAGTQFANMDAINNAIKGVQGSFDALIGKIKEHDSIQGKSYEKTKMMNEDIGVLYKDLGTKAETYFNTIVVKSEPAKKGIEEFRKLWIEYNKDQVITQAEAMKLAEVFGNVKGVQDELVTTTEQNVTVQNEAAEGFKGNSAAATTLEGQLALLDLEISQGTNIVGENMKVWEEHRGVVGGWLQDAGLLETASAALKKHLLDNAEAVKAFGKDLVITNQDTIDWTASLLKSGETHDALKVKAESFYQDVKKGIETLGKESYPIITEALEKLKIISEDAYNIVIAKLKDYAKENNLTIAGINEATAKEEEHSDALTKKKEKLTETAEALGILPKVQAEVNKGTDESIASAERLIQTEDNYQQTLDKGLQKLLDQAKARGASDDLIKNGSIPALQKYVQTNKLVIDIEAEVQQALTDMIAKRHEDKAAMEIEDQAARKLAETMQFGVDVSNMSSKGIQQLIKDYDDWKNAQQIATDEVALWGSELQKNHAIEQQTVEALKKYAEVHKIDIPEAIQGDIEKTKEHIEIIQGYGPAFDQMKKDAEAAFSAMAKKVDDIIGNLIKDEVLAGNEKKIKKLLDKIGQDMDNLSAKTAIINIAANDTDFKNKVQGIPEIITNTFQGIPPKTIAHADKIMQVFAGGLIDAYGKEAEPLVQTVNEVWEQISSDPAIGDNGQLAIDKFLEAMADPSKVAAMTKSGIIDPYTGELNKGMLEGTGITEKQLDEVAKIFGKKKPDVKKGTEEMMTGATEGIESEGKNISNGTDKILGDLVMTTGEKAPEMKDKGADLIGDKGVAGGMKTQYATIDKAANKNINEPIDKNMMLIENEATKALEPVEGVFNTAFLNASAAGTSQLAGFFVKTRTGMGTLTTQVTFQLGEMTKSFQTWGTSLDVVFGTIDQKISTFTTNFGTNATTIKDTHLTPLQTVFQTFQTNLDMWFGLIDQKILLWTQNVGVNFTTLRDTHLLPLQQNFLDFQLNIDTWFGLMDQKILTWTDNTGTNFTSVQTALGVIWKSFSDFSKSMDTYFGVMDQKIKTWASNGVSSFGTFDGAVAKTWKNMSGFSTSVSTYSTSMASSIEKFSSAGIGSLSTFDKGVGKTWGEMSKFSTSVSTYSSSMASSLKSFSSSAVSSINAVANAAKKATQALNAMAKAAAKAKSAASGSGLRYGGSIVNYGSPVSTTLGSKHAQFGKSFIADKPTKIAGVSVAEHSKPELISVIPLTDPKDISDKSIGIDVPLSPKIKPMVNAGNTRSLKSGGGNNTDSNLIRDLLIATKELLTTTNNQAQKQPTLNINLSNTETIEIDGEVIARKASQKLYKNITGLTGR